MNAPQAGLAEALRGRYDIERELGAGGMATVYLARDLRHDRLVALKVLRPELAAVIGAGRFLHEIKTTANLQHPHILPLHDSGEVAGTVFYVMPYVAGESLRDRLNREKQLPVEEAVRIAVEVAGALEYAHQHDVIHRDIKPENILIHGGHALVADFGIALAAARSDGGTRMTETGMSLGTPHYMSPEQAMGERDITAKSDVYAAGCVLYEMLIGEPPFVGPTAQSIVARVMTEEPRSLTLQRRTIPRHVEAAVVRALSKLPADRHPSAAAFADALLNPGSFTEATPAAAAPARPSRRPATALLAGAGLLAAAATFVAGRTTAPAAPSALAQFVVEMPDSVNVVGRCCGVALALSPDGRTLVFVGGSQATDPLYRRELGWLVPERIQGTEGGATPFFSPDGRWVGFMADGRLRKVALAGGPPLLIATAAAGEATWGEADVIVYSAERRLWAVPAGGGTPRPVTDPDSVSSHYAPWFLPGGRAVLFTIRQNPAQGPAALGTIRIGVVDIETGRIDTIGPGTKAAYSSGHLVYADADNNLLAQPFDLRKRRPHGSAVPIQDAIALHGSTTHEFTLSRSGALAIQRSGSTQVGQSLMLASANDRSAIPLPGRSGAEIEDPAFEPNGHRIALTIEGSGGQSTGDVWILDQQQGTLERFTIGGGWQPVWSPDGRYIAVARLDGIYVKRADGTGEDRLLVSGLRLTTGSWLPDGQSFVFQASGRAATASDIGIVSIGDTVPRWLVHTEFTERHPQVSPDGRWLAYVSNRTGQYEVYVQPLSGDGPRAQVSSSGGNSPRWSPDGRTLYYVSGGSIIAALRAPGDGFATTSRNTVVQGGVTDINGSNVNWDLHRDGKQFLYIDHGGGGAGLQMVWVVNWPELVTGRSARR
jgi:eukaryotic-like serine/threonine-protein kinase